MNRIKQLREEHKFSQSELGKKLNKTQQQISLYENGTNELDLDGYIILSKLFNCPVEYIAGKSDVKEVVDKNAEEFYYAYHKDTEGLSEQEVKDALRFYKQMKKNMKEGK